MNSGTVAGSFFSVFFDVNQPAELGEVSTFDELGLGGLSNGFRKLVVLFHAFFVPLDMLLNMDSLLLAVLALVFVFVVFVQVGHQLFLAPVEVTPLAAGALEVPNQPSFAWQLPRIERNIAPPRAIEINHRRFIIASPAISVNRYHVCLCKFPLWFGMRAGCCQNSGGVSRAFQK